MQVKLTGLLDPNKKIAAIKCLRAATSYSLRDAKAAVDSVALGNIVTVDTVPYAGYEPLDTWFSVECVVVNWEAAQTAAILAAREDISASALSSIAAVVGSAELSEAAVMLGKAYR